MDGQLDRPDGEDIWVDPPVPPFMIHVPAVDWSDEEKRLAAEFDKKKKDLLEERDKRRKVTNALIIIPHYPSPLLPAPAYSPPFGGFS